MKTVKSLIPKSCKFLNKNDFLFGFEVECVYNAEKIDSWEFEKKLHKIHPDIDFGDDGSIEPDGKFDDEEVAEIRTPPLPPSEAFWVLKQVFALVNKYGYTNASTGFHLNFSAKSAKLFKAIDPFKFTKDGLWTSIKRDFNRLNCDYCDDVWKDGEYEEEKKSQLEKFLGLLDGDNYDYHYNYNNSPISGKDAVVNFENYYVPKQADSRIEVRGFGNENYHKKFTLIRNYAEKILNLYHKCCVDTAKN